MFFSNGSTTLDLGGLITGLILPAGLKLAVGSEIFLSETTGGFSGETSTNPNSANRSF